MEKELIYLLENVKKGDDAAFEALKKRYLPLTCSVVGNFRSEAESCGVDSDDLKQEADIALCVAARTYDVSGFGVSFGSYAKVCIRNRIVSALRYAGTRNAGTVCADELCWYEDALENDPAEIVISADSCRRLMESSAKLFTDYEMDVFLLYLDGRRPAEIANALDRERKSVENALFRIRSKLGQVL